jgi:hypothetical protein
MSVLSALESPVVAEPDGVAVGTPAPAPAGPRLRIVRQAAGQDWNGGVVTPDGPQPRSSSIRTAPLSGQAGEVLLPSAVIAPRPVREGARLSPPPPLRLTRRGRVVVAVLIVAVFAAIALVVALAAAGGAQATSHGQPRAGYQGMHEIVVRPGQTLWSIASAVEPGADPRDVVQQIMTANAMTGTMISAGQLLWVPR